MAESRSGVILPEEKNLLAKDQVNISIELVSAKPYVYQQIQIYLVAKFTRYIDLAHFGMTSKQNHRLVAKTPQGKLAHKAAKLTPFPINAWFAENIVLRRSNYSYLFDGYVPHGLLSNIISNPASLIWAVYQDYAPAQRVGMSLLIGGGIAGAVGLALPFLPVFPNNSLERIMSTGVSVLGGMISGTLIGAIVNVQKSTMNVTPVVVGACGEALLSVTSGPIIGALADFGLFKNKTRVEAQLTKQKEIREDLLKFQHHKYLPKQP